MTTHNVPRVAEQNVRRTIRERLRQFAGQRLSFPVVVDAVLDLIAQTVKLAEGWAEVPGDRKKTWVMGHVEELIDQLLPLVPLPWFLAPFRAPLTKVARAWLLAIADRAVETILRHLRSKE